MRNDLCVLRKFFGWMGKPKVVRSLKEYLPDVKPERLTVSTRAKVTKSWSASGIDVEKKLDEAFAMDDRFGMMVAIQLAFGLRRKEAICVRPWVSDQRDLGKDFFIVYSSDGSKGGRQRVFPIEFKFQVWVLDYIKARIGKRSNLGWPKTSRGLRATLKQNIKHYDYCMQKLGITKKNCSVSGHGLRAEYSENCALLEGFTPATLGGKVDQMPPEDLKRAQIRVSERLGHSRYQVTASYFGSFKTRSEKAAQEESREVEKVPTAAETAGGVVTSEGSPEMRPGGHSRIQRSTTINKEPTDAETKVAPEPDSPPTSRIGFVYYENAPEGRKRPVESTD
jgi:hypothetical protein